MLFDYDILESEIETYLQIQLPNADVEVMPEKEADFKRSGIRPRITVMYGGSDFEKPQSTGNYSQHETLNIVINIRSKSRRGSNGIHGLIGSLKKKLLGRRSAHTDKFYLHSIDFEERNEVSNEWVYSVTFQARKIQIEDGLESENNGAILKQVTFLKTIYPPANG